MCIYANNRSDLFLLDSDTHIKSSNKNYKRHLVDQKAKYAGRLSWKESSSPARGRRGLLLFCHEQTPSPGKPVHLLWSPWWSGCMVPAWFVQYLSLHLCSHSPTWPSAALKSFASASPSLNANTSHGLRISDSWCCHSRCSQENTGPHP